MNILVLDDEREIADLVEVYLKNENYNVFKFYDAKEAINCIESQKLDFAILDVMVKDVDGFKICKRIRDKGLNFPVIMLTAKIEDRDKIEGLTLGADDYITKPFSVREVLARVKAQLRRVNLAEAEPDSAQKILHFGDLEIDMVAYEVRRNGDNINLTLREFELVRFLSQHAGQVFSREALLEKVWGYEYFGDVRTVDVTVRRTREKLEPNQDEYRYIMTKRGVGYYFEKSQTT